MKILLLRFSSLGDVILTMPVAVALQKKFPEAEIDLGTKLEYKALFTPPSPFKKVLYLDDTGIVPFIKMLNREEYDIIADLHASLRTLLMLPFLKAAIKKRYKKGAFARRVFVKTGFKLSAFPSIIQRYLSTFDIPEIPEAPWFALGTEEKRRGGSLLKNSGILKDRIIGIAPGAKWDTKKWSMDRYAELAQRLERRAYDVVFIFGKGDEKDREALLGISSAFRILNISDCNLRDTAYALSSMDAFVGNDTGLMHLAEAAGTPLVAMFGPTTKEFGFFPAGHKSVVMERKLVCRPCSLHGSEKCREGHHKCMEDITVEDVESAVLGLLDDVPVPKRGDGIDMAGLSVVIVTQNEQDRIKQCLESVAWADEIIVVDAFSTDKTVEICRSYTDKIYSRHWDGFIPQKNHALSLATKEWILSLDADEQLSERLIAGIKGVISSRDRDCAGYSMPRKTYYLGRWMLHSGWYPDRKTRLVRNGAAVWGGLEPHDALKVDGKICALDGDILHYSFRNLSHHIKKLDYFTDAASLELIKSGRHAGIKDMVMHPAGMFVKMFVLRKGFMDGIQGFVAASISAFHVFMKYAKAWERDGGDREAGKVKGYRHG